MTVVRAGAVPGLAELLRDHPKAGLIDGPANSALDFGFRRVQIGAPKGLRGLVELCDNNPMVCADEFSVPDAGSTLALIAVGPLIRAGILFEAPTLIYSFAADSAAVNDYLTTEGWTQGALCALSAQELGSVRALVAMAVITTPMDQLGEIDELYEEAYGRSFFVRREEVQEWAHELVAGQNHAVFRLRVTPDEPHSLLTVHVLADAEGKCGAAQVVHAMNVMAGFEESLGL